MICCIHFNYIPRLSYPTLELCSNTGYDCFSGRRNGEHSKVVLEAGFLSFDGGCSARIFDCIDLIPVFVGRSHFNRKREQR